MAEAIKVQIERFTDPHQPGWVECRLVDAFGVTHLFEEKVPVVTSEALSAESDYPRDGIVACEVLLRRAGPDGREVVTVDTERPWGVASKEGTTRFEVFRDQLGELD